VASWALQAAPSLASTAPPTAFHSGWCRLQGVGHHADAGPPGCAPRSRDRHRRADRWQARSPAATRALPSQCAEHASPPHVWASLACTRGSRVPAGLSMASEPPRVPTAPSKPGSSWDDQCAMRINAGDNNKRKRWYSKRLENGYRLVKREVAETRGRLLRQLLLNSPGSFTIKPAHRARLS